MAAMHNRVLPAFASSFNELLQKEGLSMNDCCDMWQKVSFDPCEDAIANTNGEATKSFDITLFRSDVLAEREALVNPHTSERMV